MRFRIEIDEFGLGANAILRQMLLSATCPELHSLTIVLSQHWNDVSPLNMHPFEPDRLPAPSWLYSATFAETHRTAIISADMARHLALGGLLVLVRSRYSITDIIIRDTTAFMALFHRSRSDAESVVVPDTSDHDVRIQFAD
jgi:hypothetical protein